MMETKNEKKNNVYFGCLASFSVNRERDKEQQQHKHQKHTDWQIQLWKSQFQALFCMSAWTSSVCVWCGVVQYGMIACVCVCVWPMVTQVVSFMLITHPCDFLAYALWLFSSLALFCQSFPGPQTPNSIVSDFRYISPCVCLCVYVYRISARLKWSFVGKLIAMLETPSRTT